MTHPVVQGWAVTGSPAAACMYGCGDRCTTDGRFPSRRSSHDVRPPRLELMLHDDDRRPVRRSHRRARRAALGAPATDTGSFPAAPLPQPRPPASAECARGRRPARCGDQALRCRHRKELPRRDRRRLARSTKTKASRIRDGCCAAPTVCSRRTSSSVRGSMSRATSRTSGWCATATWCRPGAGRAGVGTQRSQVRRTRRPRAGRRAAGDVRPPHRDLRAASGLTGHGHARQRKPSIATTAPAGGERTYCRTWR